MYGNPEGALILLFIIILSFIPTTFILYCLNKAKFKELIKWIFNIK